MEPTEKKPLPAPLSLFLCFAKIGLFTFGGGLAMLSFIERECAEKRGWITHDEMLEMTVLSEATPGPIAVNAATYVGWRRAGFWGAVCATAGVVLPSVAVILLIAAFLDGFLEIAWVRNAFRGIKLAVGLLIVDAGARLLKKVPKQPTELLLTVLCFAAMLTADVLMWNVSALSLLLLSAVLSAAVFWFRRLGAKRKGDPT